MSSIKEITTMCKAGHIEEAYEQALKEHEASPNVWTQRALAWVLYYKIKAAVEANQGHSLLMNLYELASLDELSSSDDNMIYENVLFKIGSHVWKNLLPEHPDTPSKLSELFEVLTTYENDFECSKGYSFLLKGFIRHDTWTGIADFIDWWNLDKLTTEDYIPYQMENGRTVMSLAEQAFITQAKALLRLNNRERIEAFLPQLEELTERYPAMSYPGYFYGKLLLSLGEMNAEALQALIPFARRKASEFWVWQLLSEAFANEEDKQLACLLRAVHCRTQESFLGKVRTKLAALYIQNQWFDLAKFQIEKVIQEYQAQGWHIPKDVANWSRNPWMETAKACNKAPLDYKSITDSILCEGADEALAVVSNVDPNSNRVTLIYGYKKRITQKLPLKVGIGVVLKISYITEADGKVRILNTEPAPFQKGLDYAQVVEGTIIKRDHHEFAFLESTEKQSFISPQLVQKFRLQDKEHIKALIVYSYNKKKDTWSWTCLSIRPKG